MKTLLKFLLILLIFFSIQDSEAQIFKKLKAKAESVISGKKDIEEEPIKTPSFGSVIITHSNTYDSVDISEVKKINVERNNDTYNFSTSWWSHDADIHDGFYLTIKTGDDLRHDTNKTENVKRTFKIPEEATLKLSYDPLLPHYKKDEDDYKRAVTDDYQTYDVSKGEVTIDVLSEDAIQISFNGRVSLRKVTRLSANSDEYSETFYEAIVRGGIDGTSPQFINNKTVKKEKQSSQNDADYTVNETAISRAKPGTYQFTFETKVKVTVSEQNRSYEMSYLLNPNEAYMGIMVDMGAYSDEEIAGESIIVMDKGNSHIFVETQGMKMQMSQNMMGGQQMQNPTDQMENYDYTNLKKTGKTKTILGATCYEYTMSDSDVKMNLWVAPDINLPNWFIQNQEILKGHIMEYTAASKEGNMTSETIAINDNINKTINPKDYRKMF
ncbi:DUF4412 domain-containing protein [Winogradskyella sp. PG-2]|uniref:DUF4412 domain-containing protein n=1 Tax=Winogradskyella sp. PG-2 TaxID=754409 RepID=UPI0004587D11|nr:DUF4412 domain-containing protein [Winogradskyella sp. PG-2]BAO75181.1 hypothetical protein WPG_0951 [Winogradskyella sp. PG-2]